MLNGLDFQKRTRFFYENKQIENSVCVIGKNISGVEYFENEDELTKNQKLNQIKEHVHSTKSNNSRKSKLK